MQEENEENDHCTVLQAAGRILLQPWCAEVCINVEKASPCAKVIHFAIFIMKKEQKTENTGGLFGARC